MYIVSLAGNHWILLAEPKSASGGCLLQIWAQLVIPINKSVITLLLIGIS